MILSDLLHFSSSHDVLISSIQTLLAKSESAKVYVGVSRPDFPTPSVVPNRHHFQRQVLTHELKSATLLLRRAKKQG